MSKEIKNSKHFLNLLDDMIDKKDFIIAFKKLLKIILKKDKKQIIEIDNAINELRSENNAFLQATPADLKVVKADLGNKIAKALKEQENGLNFIRDKVRKMEKGKDGYTPIKGKDYFDGEKGENGKDADENKIIQEVLKKIPENKSELEKLREDLFNEIRRNKRLGGGGLSKIHLESKFIDDETPSGTVNGTNKAFTLANTPNPSTSVKVFVNGMRMRITEDYTLSGKTITFITAPPANSIILCDYRK